MVLGETQVVRKVEILLRSAFPDHALAYIAANCEKHFFIDELPWCLLFPSYIPDSLKRRSTGADEDCTDRKARAFSVNNGA